METSRASLLRLCIFVPSLLILVVAAENSSYAGSKKGQQKFSKDYKKFPQGSPEAVLTALVEADLGDLINRENDERFPLWWDLTDEGGVPDDGYLKLYVKSYKIGKRTVGKDKDHLTLDLELDVRAICASGNPNTAGSSWRDVPVYVEGVRYSMPSKEFVEAVFGKGEVAQKILDKKPDEYLIEKDKQRWILPVNMVTKKGKWFIVKGSTPPQLNSLVSVINEYQRELRRLKAVIEVCNGQRGVDDYVMEPYTLDVKRLVNKDATEFKLRFCKEKVSNHRIKMVEAYANAIKAFSAHNE